MQTAVTAMVHGAPISLISPEAIELFSKYGVFNAGEAHSRFEVGCEQYLLAVAVEANLTLEIGATTILPAALRYQTELALNVKALSDAGLTPDDAARAAYLLSVYVFGSIALEIADLHQPGPLPPESERIATRHRALAATPAEHYPRAAAAAATLAGYISTQQYLWGLRRVLDGITTTTTDDP